MKNPMGANHASVAGNTGGEAISRSVTGTVGSTGRSDGTQAYLQACRTEFWQEVFRAELKYLLQHLKESREVLSIGCGPAIIESGLSERGFRITGLDVSEEALACAPDHIRAVAGRAEDMNFPKSSFDAVIYVASLQFIGDCRKAVEKTAQVLRPTGKLIVMLLNPQSAFFKEKVRDPNSYVQKIRHTSLKKIERAIANHFDIQTEYFMGVRGEKLFESREITEAALYVIRGTPRKLDENGGV